MSNTILSLIILGGYAIVAVIVIIVCIDEWIDEDEDKYRSENEDWYSED